MPGHYGVVYKSKWESHDVAVKSMNFSTFFEASKQAHLLTIIELFNLPHFVPYHGYKMMLVNNEINCKFIFDFIPNGTLHQYFEKNKNTPPNWQILFPILCDILEGITFLHEKKLVHSDLKPDNILLDHAHHAFIADTDTAVTFPATKFVATGSPLWMAPEMIAHRSESGYNKDNPGLDSAFDPAYGPLTDKVDVFSIAIILWSMATMIDAPYLQKENVNRFIDIYQFVCVEKARESIPSECPPVIANCIQKNWSPLAKDRDTAAVILDQIKQAENDIKNFTYKKSDFTIFKTKTVDEVADEFLKLMREERMSSANTKENRPVDRVVDNFEEKCFSQMF